MKCKNCNNITPLWGNNHKKYCNIICQREFEKKDAKLYYSIKNCIVCSNEFIPKSFVNTCCSRKCKSKLDVKKRSKKPNFKTCSNCNNKFNPYTSLDKFCSANCRVANIKKKRKFNWNKKSVEKRMGINNPAYVNGDRVFGKKINSKGIRSFQKNKKERMIEMIENEGYTFCEKCNQPNKILEAHHIIYRSEKPNHEKLHDKINITLLCMGCHDWYHKKKGNRNDIVKERNLHLVFGNDVLDK